MTQQVTQHLTERTGLLELRDISVRLGGRQVLSDVRFTIRKGEFTGLIGPNGAGKTTLIRVILGLQDPSGGQVLVDGAPRQRSNRSIGYVPQKIVIDSDIPLRARDVVSLGLDGHKLGFAFPSRRRRELVDKALCDVGALKLRRRAGRRAVRRRAAAGADRARAGQPAPLLLLDEPLANLDLRSEQEIVTVLGKLAREQEIAVLLSAHDMNPLLPVMDRIIYVANGKVATGSTDEVVTSEGLTRLYGHPVDVLRVRGRVSWWLASKGEQGALPLRARLLSSGPVLTAFLVGAIAAITSGIIGVFSVLRGQ